MKEEFALKYAAQRAKEKGFKSHRIVYREFILPAKASLKFQAPNEIWLLTHVDWGMIVKSDHGRYQNWYVQGITENTHEHGDRIEVLNTRNYQRRVRFLQVILKTGEDDGKQT